MSRHYFLDTNAIVGLVFLSDRWFSEIRPIYQKRHQIHITDIVLYEYCNRNYNTQGNIPDSSSITDIDWNVTGGVYRMVEKQLKKSLSSYFREVREVARDGLTLGKVKELFISEFEIREQARRQVESYFDEYFEQNVLSEHYVCSCAQDLVDHILNTAQKNHEQLEKTVLLHQSTYMGADTDLLRICNALPDAFTKKDISNEEYTDYDDPWKIVDYSVKGDLAILIDAIHLDSKIGLRSLISGDSDILRAQEFVNNYYDVSVLSISDEFTPENDLMA
jgi:hypothetical protein